MKILVTGSRKWRDGTAIKEQLLKYDPKTTTIIHGAALGADSLAGYWGSKLGFTIERYPADWKKHGKSAGPIRNDQMLDLEPDLVLAFWDGSSKGTKHCIDGATARGYKVEIIKG